MIDATKSRVTLDLMLLLSTVILVIIGILFNYSSEHPSIVEGGKNVSLLYYEKQLLFLIPGIIGFLMFLFIDYDRLSRVWWLLLGISLIALVFVLTRPPVKGTRSWIQFFGFGIQPSEPVKIVFIIVYSKFLSHFKKHIQNPVFFIICLAVPLPILGLILIQPDYGTAIVYIPIILGILFIAGAKVKHLLVIIAAGVIALSSIYPYLFCREHTKEIISNELETAVMDSLLLKLVFDPEDLQSIKNLTDNSIPEKVRAGIVKRDTVQMKHLTKKLKDEYSIKENFIKMKFIRFSILLGLIFMIPWLLNFLFARRFNYAIFNSLTALFLALVLGIILSVAIQYQIESYQVQRLLVLLGVEESYNVKMSTIAIGSGGMWGLGYLGGLSTRLNYVPEKQTDFIFSVMGEQLGFMGSILLIILYIIFIYRGFKIVYEARDTLGTLMATGVVMMIIFHIIINLGMVIGIMPVMGLPLPFISAGGSNLITCICGTALLLNIGMKRIA